MKNNSRSQSCDCAIDESNTTTTMTSLSHLLQWVRLILLPKYPTGIFFHTLILVENEFIIGQNSTNFIVHNKGDWENSAVFTYLHIYFLKINSVTIQIVNDIDNIWCSPQKILLHFLYCISPKILLQYCNISMS